MMLTNPTRYMTSLGFEAEYQRVGASIRIKVAQKDLRKFQGLTWQFEELMPGGLKKAERVAAARIAENDEYIVWQIFVDGWTKDYLVQTDHVNHPNHYNKGKFEVIDVIEDWQLNFRLGNTVKYIARAGHKGNRKQDLQKALWYLQREIDKTEEK